jgi:hypothetical protein
MFYQAVNNNQRPESNPSWSLNLEGSSSCIGMIPTLDPLIVPAVDPVIVPVRDPVIVPAREPLIVPTREPLERDPGIVPANETVAKEMVKSTANDVR